MPFKAARLDLFCLNESPYEKVGKFASGAVEHAKNLAGLNESPYEKVGKLEGPSQLVKS